MEKVIKKTTGKKATRKKTFEKKDYTEKENLFINQVLEQIEKVNASDWEHYLKDLKILKPINAVTEKEYSRFNSFTLLMDMIINHHQSNKYATFKQITAINGKLKKGSKSTIIEFFSWSILHKETKKRISQAQYNDLSEVQKKDYSKFCFVKNYRVFNLAQVEDFEDLDFTSLQDELIDEVEEVTTFDTIIQNLVENKGLKLIHKNSNTAFYTPLFDTVTMPNKNLFKSTETYYYTLFHELSHWTGHSSRLDRDLQGKKSENKYAFEELIAELSAMLLCFNFDFLSQFKNSLSYLKGWSMAVQEDRGEALKKAFKDATRANNYLLN